MVSGDTPASFALYIYYSLKLYLRVYLRFLPGETTPELLFDDFFFLVEGDCNEIWPIFVNVLYLEGSWLLVSFGEFNWLSSTLLLLLCFSI